MIAGLPFQLPEPLEARLRAAYAHPPRAYHSFDHVLEVLSHFATVKTWSDPHSVALAVLFHDAVYAAGRTDNEAESARLFERHASELVAHVAFDPGRVVELILLTARHGALDGAALDADAALFLDCDMAILGADPQRYADYERAIAEEYRALSPAVYRAGRARFLQKLLASPRIYLSELFATRLEQKARQNLARALAAL